MPDVLYHYTSMKGAEGILSSRRFWASTHDCRNDNAELVSADSIIKEVGQTLRKTATGTAAAVLDLFLDRYERLHVTQVMNVCLACFSLAKDDRDQWVKYGADGRGSVSESACLMSPALKSIRLGWSPLITLNRPGEKR
jgi:hypothetical protein